ncbi:sugar transferase [Deinococcus seoulensis]|nr:sugar transferase [Deinococcus seoulensis]
MMLSKFHHNDRVHHVRSLQTMLVGIDATLLVGLVTIIGMTFHSEHLRQFIALWLLSGAAGWLISRERRHALVLDSYMRAIIAPVTATLIAALLQLIFFNQLNILSNFLILATWSITMIINRLTMRRRIPVIQVGTMGAIRATYPHDQRIEYVPLTRPEDITLREVDALLIDPAHLPSERWLDVVSHAHTAGMPVWTPTTLNEEIRGRVSLEYLQTAHMNRSYFKDSYAPLKRVLDLTAILLFAPFLLTTLGIVALIVLLDAGRPVLFWQTRIGQNGRPFRIAKFRTMKTDSEAHGAAFARTGDTRITRIGKVLRKFRLDELPQFYNVLRGDMSIIGPRPEQEAFVQEFQHSIHLYPVRHWVKPGITGWAQVRHGYAAGEDETIEKLRFDMYYVKNFSFALDARVVAHTLWTIMTGFGAR